MRLLNYELFKVISRWAFLALFVILCLVNGLFLLNKEQSKNIAPAAVKQIYQDIEPMSMEEKTAYLEQGFQDMEFYRLLSNVDMESKDPRLEQMIEEYKEELPAYTEKYKQGNYLKYTDDISLEQRLYKQVLFDVNEAVNYQAYLDNIDVESKRMTNSIFSAEGTFSYNNALITPSAFDHLKGNQLNPQVPDGIVMATKSDMTDIIMVLLMIIAGFFLVMQEKEKGLLPLIKPTFRGRFATALAKIGALFVMSLLIVVVLFGTNLFIAVRLYGLGDLSRLIQSVSGFLTSPFQITVLQYLILYFVTKLVVCFIIALLVYFFCTIARESVVALTGFFLVAAVSVVCNLTIAATSWLDLLKYVNLAEFIKVWPLYSRYLNLNLFEYPVNIIPLFLVFSIVLIVGLSVISILIFCRQKNAVSSNQLLKQVLDRMTIKSKRVSVCLLRYEFSKLLLANKALLLILIFLLVQGFSFSMFRTSLSDDELYYRDFMIELQGELTPEKEVYLAEKTAYFHQLQNEINEIASNPDLSQQEIQSKTLKQVKLLKPSGGFQMAYQKYETILENRDQGIHTEFVYDTGYDYLTGKNANSPLQTAALLMSIFAVMCAASVYGKEHEARLHYLVRSAQHGRQKTIHHKSIAISAVMVVLYAVSQVPYYLYICEHYKLSLLRSPVTSLSHLAWMGDGVSILGYFILIHLIQLVGVVLLAQIVLCFSVYAKNTFLTIVVSFLVFVLPVIAFLLGFEQIGWVTWTNMLDANTMFANQTSAVGIFVYLTVILALSAASCYFLRQKYCNNGLKRRKS